MNVYYCPYCLRPSRTPLCEHCGSDTLMQNELHQLPVGTVLREQYRVGKVLGQGGFGITYLGLDIHLNTLVAIKEYFPTSMVIREHTTSLEVFTYGGDAANRFHANRERFLREAQSLAKLSHIPNIVRVKSFFLENNTAYIVMEYVQGVSLLHYTEEKGGKLAPEETFRLLRPVMSALEKVHEIGLVHRDLSPDNIMLLPDGTTKLLDFGAVRDVEGADAQTPAAASTETILKMGYAPIEQYQRRGSLGPWTDVYALCATIYFCMTGNVPPEAPERMMGIEELDWAKDVPALTQAQAAALEHGMAHRAKDRTPSVTALTEELFGKKKPEPPKTEQKPKRKAALLLPAAAICLLLLFGTMILRGLPVPEKTVSEPTIPTGAVPDTSLSTIPTETTPAWENNQLMMDWMVSMTYTTPETTADVDSNVGNGTVLGSQYKRRHIQSVSFLDTLAGMPADAWDVSASGNGSVMAWVTPEYELCIAGEGGVSGYNAGYRLFAGYFNLTQVNFNGAFHPAGELSDMFYGCKSLEKIDLRQLDLTQATKMDRMFYGCTKLQEVLFPQSESPYLNSISAMFTGCTDLAQVDLSNLDLSSVTNMQSLFSSCTNLKEVNFTGVDTRSLTDMSYMFYECNALETLDLSSFDTANVTTMSHMFRRCISLKDLNIRSFDTTRVEAMNSMFDMCESLEVLDLSHFWTPRLQDMRYMFEGSEKLRELYLTNFDTSGVTSMILLFCGCESLEVLDISSFDTSGVTDMRNMFERCDKLFDLDLSHFDTSNVAQYEGFTTNNRLVKGRNWRSLFQ